MNNEIDAYFTYIILYVNITSDSTIGSHYTQLHDYTLCTCDLEVYQKSRFTVVSHTATCHL